MESRELFLLLHLLPFHWVGGGGAEALTERLLSLLNSLARLFLLQTDTMFQKLCPSCSHASEFKRRLFSQTPPLPSFFFFFFYPKEEGWSGPIHLCPSLKSLGPCRACARPCSGTRCAEQPVRCRLQRVAYETAALTSSTGTTSGRWNRSSTGLRLRGWCSDSSPTRPPPPKWNTLLSEAPWGRI